MAINNLGTGLRPGVVTSTTRPTNPYEGQVIYETDTDKVLVWNNSAWLFLSTPQATEIGAWQAWIPTFTSTAGAITTSSLTRARYLIIQKLVIARFEFVITTAGGGAGGYLDFTAPITATSNVGGGTSIGFGREYAATGFALNVIVNSPTSFRVTNFDNAGVVQSGRNISAQFTYEAA